MAAVEITISGVLYDKLNRTTQPVVLIGEASLTGLGLGGGPIVPPAQPPSDPVHIWGGGNVPMPSPPIANVPGAPGYRPPEPGAPPDPGLKPPPAAGGWGYVGLPGYGWAYYPGPHEAGPKT